jgi:hypothetical protein
MADQDTPTRSSNMEKAEGDRQDTPEARYNERGSGSEITRPLGEEVEHQKEVPARG